ncbi:helix-turn-helix domain-containing protein [Actinomadura scrupuli]|uniref:helix-turn-helix domain-containing protein n=1 Tax=Actinomadura scrupuli TaxID=559629 RepID=UPI003D979A5D
MGTLTGDQHGGRPGGRPLTTGEAGPTLSRMILGMRLRRHRESRGLTREQAADTIRASDSKISRLELGRVGFRLRDVIDLCDLYGVTDHTERAALLGLARQANTPAWWARYGAVIPSWFEPYLGLEQQAATLIRCYEVQFVPGLLQTPDYAAGVISIAHGDAGDADLELRLEVRMRRQRILSQTRPPHVWAVVDEAALRRPIGGRAAMFRQLQHLIDLCDLPHVTVQLLPFRSGGHAAAGGPVTMLCLPEPGLSDVVYLEQLTSASYLDGPDEVLYYRHVMNLLATQAAPPSQTPSILRRISGEL